MCLTLLEARWWALPNAAFRPSNTPWQALVALGVDNCLLQVNGPEFPILDGSSILYVEQIQKVGLENQGVPRNYLEINEPFEYYDEISGSCLRVQPADRFAVDSTIEFPDSQVCATTKCDLRAHVRLSRGNRFSTHFCFCA